MKAPSRFAPRLERTAYGRALRSVLRRVDQGPWISPAGRAGIVDVLRGAEQGRVAALLPIKYGRMRASPFAFFRGAAPIMAADLAKTKVTGFEVQICGDAHVRNLGSFAAPDGHIVFDINDFDETCRAPWEWDLRRLTTSFVLAGREAGDSDRACGDAVMALVRSYRESMARFATMPGVALARYEIQRHIHDGPVHEVLGKAARVTPMAALQKLARRARGDGTTWRFAQQRPLLTRVEGAAARRVTRALVEYRSTLGPARQLVLDAYRPVDVAFKVVGTGSVGTRNYVVLCFGNGPKDPLLLQVKQAIPSCYARYLPRGAESLHEGRRVAEGQHRLQTVADPFLGWTTLDGAHYLVRQLADHKASIDPADLKGPALLEYAMVCGEIFAKAHARTGDAAVLAGYAGTGDKLDRALADFASAYADQATRDWEAFACAIKRGRLA